MVSPSFVSGGSFPSGGSTINDVRRDTRVHHSYQCSGPAPTPRRGPSSWPPSSPSSRRLANSSSFKSSRVPNCGGRSNGTPYIALVHSPCRSGCPHGVRGGVETFPPDVPGCIERPSCAANGKYVAATRIPNTNAGSGREDFIEWLLSH